MSRAHPSRTDRWSAACEAARAALDELVELRDEYSEWRDGIPENLEQSATAEKLDAVLDLDLEGGLDAIDAAEELELPLGFGRD